MSGAPVTELEYMHDNAVLEEADMATYRRILGWYHEYTNLVPETAVLGMGFFCCFLGNNKHSV